LSGFYTNAQTFTNYTVESTSLCINKVHAIVIDSLGNKWFGTDGGVSKFDGTTWTTYADSNHLICNVHTAIAIDGSNNIWMTTASWWCLMEGCGLWPLGVSKFDGTNWTTYNTIDGLADEMVNAIAIDAEGNKWFGTGGGVSKFDDTTWTTYTESDGLVNNQVNAIAIDSEGNKWFGTGGGVSKFDDTTWTTCTTLDGLVNNCVNAIAIDAEGNKWFATVEGISKLSADGNTVNISVSPGNQKVGFNAGSTTFNVSSNTIWTISDDADWLSVSQTGCCAYGIIIANFIENTSTSSRVATITISGQNINSQSVTITQSGNPFISVPSFYDLKVTIYPNPVKDYLFIKFDNSILSDISISIVDVSGRVIIKRNFENIYLDAEETLDLSFMKSGLYFIEIKSEKNSKVYKIIKE